MKNIQPLIEKLNPEQRKAVETIDGPVLVVAGPGTGKTQVLALRIANILSKTDVSASNILCLTFTESAVFAMRKRLLEMIGTEAYYVRIHTFHSFCNEVIQTFPEEFIFSKELTQLDDLSRLKVIREAIDNVEKEVGASVFNLIPFRDKYLYSRTIIGEIQTLKREGIAPEILEEVALEDTKELEANPQIGRTGKPTQKYLNEVKSSRKNFELARIYKEYSALLNEKGFYDYEDMILFVINKFKENEEILSYYQEKFLYILVDEYQDTNGAQNEILKLLGSFDSSPNIFAVGDDDQAIYRFQGANVENLLSFTKHFENVETIPITTNYRSSQNILDLSSSVIKNNKARLVNKIPFLVKDLKAGLPIKDHKAEIFEFNNNDSENRYLVEKIKLLQEAGEDLNEIAILYRNHSDAEDIAEALIKNNIPVQFAVGKNSLDEITVQKFLDLLKVIEHEDKDRDFMLFKVLFFDFLKFDRLDIFKLTKLAGDNKVFITDLLLKDEFKEQLEQVGFNNLEALTDFLQRIINWKADSKNQSLIQFMENLGKESGFFDYIFGNTNVEDINSVVSFFDYVKQTNRINKRITLGEFLSDLKTLDENGITILEKELETNKNGVNLMTAHRSKGLEYKHVFIIKFYDKNWGGKVNRDIIKLPKNLLGSTEEDVDETEDERRLFFVALTRAREHIYISYAKQYPSGNSTKEVSPSQFLSELDSNLIERKDSKEFEEFSINSEKNSLFPSTFSYSPEEKDFLELVISKFRLSASALNEYLECPLKFKFNRLLKVPRARDKVFAIGTAIHFAFEHYYRSLMKGEVKDLNYMLFLFEEQLKRELLGVDDYNSSLAEGKSIITDYYNFYKDSFKKPIDVEYGFYGKNLMLELPNIEAIPLSGKIDRIEFIGNTDNDPNFDPREDLRIRFVDYKTSSPKTLGQIKGTTKDSTGGIFRQAVFYKLLAECDKTFRPTPTSAKYKVEEILIDFLKPDSKEVFRSVPLQVTFEDIEALKVVIADTMVKIRNLGFDDTAEHPWCKECEYCKLFVK